MNRFNRVVRRDVFDPHRVAPPPEMEPMTGPALYAAPFPPPDGFRSPVHVADPVTGEVFEYEGSMVVMPVPKRMRSKDATVNGNVVTFGDARGAEVSEELPTMRLADFAVRDVCLMPTRFKRYPGRTCWYRVRILSKS